MPRFIRNPFSLRQCKCLFVSVLLVCAVMVLVALKFHPELVKASLYLEASSNTIPTSRKARISAGKDITEQNANGETDWTESIQFLPHTETTAANTDSLQSDKGYESSAPQNLESIINAGPIYYHNKVPNYVPDVSAARGNNMSKLAYNQQ